MTTKTMYPDGHVTELRDDGRQFVWYPRGERLVVDAAQFAPIDQRDARISELETALRKVSTMASEAMELGRYGGGGGMLNAVIFLVSHLATIREAADAALVTEPERDMQTVSEELGY